MTRLIFWYGVKYEDRGQAYSFVPGAKLISYEEGQRKGYCTMPKKIQKKIERKAKLTKTEEQIKRGLKEITADMQKDKSDRAAWMMQFKEDYELAEEEAAQEEEEQRRKAALVGEEEGDAGDDIATIPKKRKPGRPKKDDNAEKPAKRKPGRPKKVLDELPPEPEDDDEEKVPKKRKPGRPKKSEKEKAHKSKSKSKKKESTAKKWVTVDEDQESEIETEDDEGDRDYDEDGDSGDDVDVDVDEEEDSDAGKSKKRKSSSSDEKSKKQSKVAMTEEEKALERRNRAAEYREKKAREKAEAQGLEYVKGRVGRKSKKTILEEEQQKFTKCEEVFLPMMDRLTALAKDASNVKSALKCIDSITERADLLTPPFLRAYPLGMLVKTVRKSFERGHPKVKEQCKLLTAEMKRVYSEKEKKVPDGFEAVKNKKPTLDTDDEEETDEEPESTPHAALVSHQSEVEMKTEKVELKKENASLKSEKIDVSMEHPIPKTNSTVSLSEPPPRKMAGVSSSECLPEAVKSEQPQPKQKKMFSIKGMFEKPKPPPRPKISAPASMAGSGQPSPKPKALPSWVTGPAMKMESFHEQHAKERNFGLEYLIDAASLVTTAKRFDPVSVSQSFELAIFAETKLRGRDWQQYWEKVHDVVAMLSPGKDKRNAILKGIISGDYREPSELVKLSRREIQSLNQLKR
ncbi:hypothetical protein ACHAWF_008666 [Thalassiosira exigua]